MAADPSSPEVLVSLADEMEAAAIASVLADHGIRARVIGGYTSGFRAEAPGEVRVVVGQADMARAQTVLAEIRDEPAEIDWSRVDCGDDSAASDREDGSTGSGSDPPSSGREPAAEEKLGRFQFSIATLLVLQTIVSAELAAWSGTYTGVLALVALFGATLVLIVGGTAKMASDLTRTRRVWAYVAVRWLTVALAVLAPLLLVPIVLEVLGFSP